MMSIPDGSEVIIVSSNIFSQATAAKYSSLMSMRVSLIDFKGIKYHVFEVAHNNYMWREFKIGEKVLLKRYTDGKQPYLKEID